MAMNDKPELSDADLRAMLDRRADRALQATSQLGSVLFRIGKLS